MADDVDKAQRPAADAGRARSDQQNEWTASDKRGPLGAATAEEEAAAAERARELGTPPAETPHGSAPEPHAGLAEPSPQPPVDPASEPVAGEHVAGNTASVEPAPVDPAPVESAPLAPERRRTPVLPLVAALVVGAIIGAGSAAVVYKSSDQGASPSDVNALASRLDALEKRPDPQPALDKLQADVAKASAEKPAAPAAPAFDPTPLQQKIDGLAGDVDALKKQDADHALADRVAALDGSVAGLKTQAEAAKSLDEKVTALTGSIDGLKKEDQSAQAGIASLQSGQKTLESKTGAPALAVAADSLVVAIGQGRPYAGQVDALAALGADATKLAVLRESAEKGVPSAQALAAKFAPLADPVIATASQAPPDAGLGDRLKSGFFGMVSVRRSDAMAGDDVASRVARIEADLANGDIAGAYDTWNGLPAAAKAKSDAWGALAKTQVEAMGAARALQSQAIAALGGRKS